MARRRVVGALLVTVVALTLVCGAVAAPPPTKVCALCHGEFDAATGPGTLDIHLDDEGDARWVERVPVAADAAQQYRDDPQRRADAVDDAWGRYLLVDDSEVTNRSSVVEGTTLVVTYTVEGVAERGVGETWLVTQFLGESLSTRYHVGGEVTLHPPDGHEVTTRVPGGEHADGTVTWRGDATDDPDRALDPETVVTYGPGGFGSTLASYATLAATYGPRMLLNGLVAGILPTVTLAAGALAVARYPPTGRVLGRVTTGLHSAGPRRLGRMLAGAGAVVGLVSLGVGLATRTGLLVGFGVGGVGYAVLALAACGLATRGGRRLLAGTLAVTAGCGLLLLVLPVTVGWTPLVLSTGALLPVGYAAESGDGMVPPLALALAGPTLALAVVVPVYLRGGLLVLVGLLLVPSVAGVVLAGYPLSVLGRLLVDER
jgi:hypothetical protein